MEQSVEADVSVKNRLGLHARPAALIAKTCAKFQASVTLTRQDTGAEADGKSLLNLLMLGAPCGCLLHLKADGPDASEVLQTVKEMIESGFDEE